MSDESGPAGAGFTSLVKQLVPWLQWPEMRRTCLAQKACSREVVLSVHERYLTQAPTGIPARLERLGRRLNGAQAAQAKGSPEALARASSDLLVLRQSAFVLARNCENYADLFEHVGFVVEDQLDTVASSVLDAIERVQSFQVAVDRLVEASIASQERPRISCRAHVDDADDD